MRVQLTDFGANLLDNSAAPVTLTGYKLGSDFGYVPAPADLDIHGAEIFAGTPSAPRIMNPNVICYSVLLDYDVGDFTFGEIGLFVGTDLFALATGDVEHLKQSLAQHGAGGNSIRIDVYLSMVGSNYDMWVDYAQTGNRYRMPNLRYVDQLPPSRSATPNAYVVSGYDSAQSAFLAVTDRQGLWAFDCYKFQTSYNSPYTVISASAQEIVVAHNGVEEIQQLPYIGHTILQFSSGACYGVCRNVSNVVVLGTEVRLILETPLAVVPVPGDTLVAVFRDPLSSTSFNIPRASDTVYGIVRIGAGIDVNNGTISVTPSSLGGVASVNEILPDVDGNVELYASDISGSVLTVNGLAPDADGNVSTTYALPIATETVLGGVRQAPERAPGLPPYIIIDPVQGHLQLSFVPVTSINGAGGDIVIEGLIYKGQVPPATAARDIEAIGLYYIEDTSTITDAPPESVHGAATLEVMPLSDIEQANVYLQYRWTDAGGMSWISTKLVNGSVTGWVSGSAAIPLATDTQIGGMKLGESFELNTDQQLEIKVPTPTVRGGVTLGDGFVISPVTGEVIPGLRTVNGQYPDADGNVDVSDSGFLVEADKNVQNGVAALDEDPNYDGADPIEVIARSDYLFGRIERNQISHGTLRNLGLWDATSATLTGLDARFFVNYAGTADVTLLDNGNATVAITPTEPELDPMTLTDVTLEGVVLEVSVDGGTTLDGESSWRVGDLLVSLNGRWRKIGSSVSTGAAVEVAINAGQSHNVVIPAGVSPLDASLNLKVRDPDTPTIWYEAHGVATVEYTTTTITVVNESSENLTFRYYLKP